MRYFKHYLILLLAVILFPLTKASNPWIRPWLSSYFQIGGSFNAYQMYHNGFLNFQDQNRWITDQTLQAYTEIGLPKRFMLSVSLPATYLSSSPESFSPAGDSLLPSGCLFHKGNISLEGQYGFYQRKGLVMTAGIRLLARSAGYSETTGLRTGYDAWGFGPTFSLGYSHADFYTTLRLAGIIRLNGYSEQALAAYEAGWKLGKRYYLAGELSALISTLNGSITNDNAEQYALYPDYQTYGAIVFKFGVKLPKNFGLWLSAGGGFGKGVPTGVPVSLTLSWEWKEK